MTPDDIAHIGTSSSPLRIDLAPRALLDLLRLGSAALPLGAFAYSQALESAVARGNVSDEATALAWIAGLCRAALLPCDVPVLVRLHDAFRADDGAAVLRWNAFLVASRTTRELRAEEAQLGGSLHRLLVNLGSARALAWNPGRPVALACAFALHTVERGIPREGAALSYGFAWSEAQVGAATRLVPLGQTSAQRTLSAVLDVLSSGFEAACALPDEEIRATTFGQAVLSSLHEVEYTRLFRS
jgi:urease accessory protein